MATREASARKRLGYLLTRIASGEPAPASGAAAAAVLAASAALLQKVALRSPTLSDADAVHKHAEQVRLRAEELIELDSVAFNDFIAATRAGEDIEAARNRTIDTPLEIARAGATVVDLAHRLESEGNQNLRPDAVAAGILAHSAVTVAAMLVQVNLAPGEGDARLAEARRLMRAVSGSVRRRAARGRPGDRGRDAGQSRDSGPPSRPRADRGDRSAGSAGRRRASSRSR